MGIAIKAVAYASAVIQSLAKTEVASTLVCLALPFNGLIV
jgi:hypothetical protein